MCKSGGLVGRAGATYNFQLQPAICWEGQAASLDGGHAFHVAGQDSLVSAV